LRRVPLVVLVCSMVRGAAGCVRMYAQTPIEDCPKAPSVDGNVIPPLMDKRVNPQYPGIAQSQLLDGSVVMNVTVASDGFLRDIRVTHGLPQLIPAATHAVEQWHYEPTRTNGVAMACKVTITVGFTLISDPKVAAAATSAANYAPRIVPPSGVIGVKPVLPAPPDGVLRVSSRVIEPQMVKRVEPAYPPDAVSLDARGVLYILLTISKTGEVADAQVLTGPFRFRNSAIEAVKQWKFRPYQTDGEPREVQTMVSLDFAPTK
jgi:TonB family protein